jgi:FHS family Na+ dependent glucose MFS transporter 1
MSKTPVRPRALTASLFFSFLALGLAVAVLGPSLPYLAEATGTLLRLASFVFIAHRVGYILGSYFGGALYDRFSGSRLMAVSLLLLAGALWLVPLQQVFALLLPVVFVLGLAEGTVDVGGNALLLWMKPSRLPILMNALHLFFGVGAFLGPLVLALAVRWTGGILWGYRILAVLVVPPAIWLFRLSAPSLPQDTSAGSARSGLGLLTLLIVALFFLVVAAEAGYGDWIYTYALTRGLADPVRSGYLTSVYWGAFTVGRLLATIVSVRVKPKTLLLGSFIGAAASICLLLLWPDNRALPWLVSIAFGLSMAAQFPSLVTLAGDSITVTGRAAGLFLVGANLGGMAVPWLIGQFFESAGTWVAPAAILTAAAGGLLVLLAVLASIRRRPQREQSA